MSSERGMAITRRDRPEIESLGAGYLRVVPKGYAEVSLLRASILAAAKTGKPDGNSLSRPPGSRPARARLAPGSRPGLHSVAAPVRQDKPGSSRKLKGAYR